MLTELFLWLVGGLAQVSVTVTDALNDWNSILYTHILLAAVDLLRKLRKWDRHSLKYNDEMMILV